VLLVPEEFVVVVVVRSLPLLMRELLAPVPPEHAVRNMSPTRPTREMDFKINPPSGKE
jgi:hypothetical protein